MPKVSVIIPTYNYARYLGEAVQSVLDQTLGDFELIVVDDGSTDNTREVVGGFKDSRIRYIYQENRGAAAAQNTGIKSSCGEYIAILGADDTWLPQSLESRAKLLDLHPDVALVCSDIYIFDNNTGATLGRLWHDMPAHYRLDLQRATQKPLIDLIAWGCFIWPQAAILRRLVFAEVGYFDESFSTCEDWDLFLRIVQRFSIKTIDVPLARIRRHNVSLTANNERMHGGEVATLHKLLRSGSLSQEERKLVKRKLAPMHLRYGRQAIQVGKLKEGKNALIAAIKVKPWGFKPYLHLIMSLLGNKKLIVFKPWKKRLSSTSSVAR